MKLRSLEIITLQEIRTKVHLTETIEKAGNKTVLITTSLEMELGYLFLTEDE